MASDTLTAEEAGKLLADLNAEEVPHAAWKSSDSMHEPYVWTFNNVAIGTGETPAVRRAFAAAPTLARTVIQLEAERDAARDEVNEYRERLAVAERNLETANVRARGIPRMAESVAAMEHALAVQTKRAERLEDERDAARADLAALRIEHGAVAGLLQATRVDRDEARQLLTNERAVLNSIYGVIATAGTPDDVGGREAVALLVKERDRLRDILRCERGEWAPEGWIYVFAESKWRKSWPGAHGAVWRRWARNKRAEDYYEYGFEIIRDDGSTLEGAASCMLDGIEAADFAARKGVSDAR